MELISSFPNLEASGPEKKELLLEVVYQIVKRLKIDEDDRVTLMYIVEVVLPISIDVIISISYDGFSLQTLKKKAKKWNCLKPKAQ